MGEELASFLSFRSSNLNASIHTHSEVLRLTAKTAEIAC
ncbi:hypothetical protein B4119_3824 [Parageobacillus caldoxylosilyticus]|uniref:Uncharacterized protein n=1 Tax=Saccharococcus caldoxylosilyticus TaxID=81408 RepID=A0A150M323_9BACL|nr:hypothetical protein B4119_3824 [Parageobacillus caldoxylosilyticus]